MLAEIANFKQRIEQQELIKVKIEGLEVNGLFLMSGESLDTQHRAYKSIVLLSEAIGDKFRINRVEADQQGQLFIKVSPTAQIILNNGSFDNLVDIVRSFLNDNPEFDGSYYIPEENTTEPPIITTILRPNLETRKIQYYPTPKFRIR